MSRVVDVGSVKTGTNILIDGEPCRVVSIDKSKPGKHGSAKVRIVAIGIFDGVKRSFVGPVDTKVEIPVVEKRSGQVISVTPSTVQIMDLSTYEVFEVSMPKEEELASKIKVGAEVEYLKVANRVKINKVRGPQS